MYVCMYVRVYIPRGRAEIGVHTQRNNSIAYVGVHVCVPQSRAEIGVDIQRI